MEVTVHQRAEISADVDSTMTVVEENVEQFDNLGPRVILAMRSLNNQVRTRTVGLRFQKCCVVISFVCSCCN